MAKESELKKRERIAKTLAEELKTKSVEAIFVYGSVATGLVHAGSDIDLKVLLSKGSDWPKGLDSWGVKHYTREGIEITVDYITVERLKEELDDEGGCGFLSGVTYHMKPLYGTKTYHNRLKKLVLDAKRKRLGAVEPRVGDLAEGASNIAYFLGKGNKTSALFHLLETYNDMIETSYLLNNKMIDSSKSYFDDLGTMNLPKGYLKDYKSVMGADRFSKEEIRELADNLKKYIKKMKEMYENETKKSGKR